MRTLTESKRNEIVATLWADAKTEHDCDSFNVPHTVTDFICEVDRALHVLLLAWDDTNTNPAKLLNTYMVKDEVKNYVLTTILEHKNIESIEDVPKATEKRSDKYLNLKKFALDNLYKEFTTQELINVSGLSSQTLVTWIRANGYFRAMKRGMWEARNPNDDRKNVNGL